MTNFPSLWMYWVPVETILDSELLQDTAQGLESAKGTSQTDEVDT